ncbi:hypothetical protein Gpo141_00001367 [Globisporangium polare]
MSAAESPPAPIQSGVSMSQLRAMAGDPAEVAPQQTKGPYNNKNSQVTHLKKGSAITREDCLHFAHRLGIFVAALYYVVSCLQSVPDTVRLLRGLNNPTIVHAPQDSSVMRKFIGSSTIRQSPLVLSALGGSTSPVLGTIYLNSTGGFTNSPCDAVTQQQQAIQIMYGDTHLRTLYQWTVASASYNLTFLDPSSSELIAPVVDCTINGITQGETTFLRAFYLVRRVQNPDDVYMVSLNLANMEYTLPDQSEGGPAGVATLSYVNDLTSTALPTRHMLVSIGFPFEKLDFRVYEYKGVTSTGTWALRTIPKYPNRELAKNLFASARSGCFVISESEQSNVNNELWVLEPNPADTLAQIRFSTVALLRDSWAWVHLVELWLGFDVLVNLIILVVVSCHNLARGTLWMGDSFVAVSSTLLFRGVIVILSWYVDKFWSVTEFCTCDASAVANVQTTSIYASITHADLLSLYLSLSGVLGLFFRERVDPLFAVLCFEIGYGYRREFLQGFPSLLKPVVAYAHEIYTSSTQAATTGQENITPMQFRTTFATTGSASVNLAVLAAVLWSFGIIVLYIVACKVYVRFFPERLLILRSKNTTSQTHKSDNEEALLAQKRQYTLFEVATGAQLENRFGLMSHYITCVFVKGTKFASADGIYCNGFVIANAKFLVQARDLLWIVLMKLTQARFTNVYVYELKGSSVQQKARLVYPETLTWKDLLLINITILS